MAGLKTELWVPGRDAALTSASGVDVQPWLDRRGVQIMKEEVQQWVREGRVFYANAGTITAPITFGAGSIDSTEPDLDVVVPFGTIIVPLMILVQMETFGTTLLWEGMASVGAGAAGARTNGVAVTPQNARTDKTRTSACSIVAAVDASGATYQTLGVAEIWRFGANKIVDVATAIDTSTDFVTQRLWVRGQMGFAPHVAARDGTNVGRLNVFSASQAGTGFITLAYAEFNTDEYGI